MEGEGPYLDGSCVAMSPSPFLKLYGRLQFLQLLCSGSGHGGVDHSKGGDHSGPVPKPHGDHFNDLELPFLTLCPGERGGCVELAGGGLPHGGELQAGVCPWPGHPLLW